MHVWKARVPFNLLANIEYEKRTNPIIIHGFMFHVSLRHGGYGLTEDP